MTNKAVGWTLFAAALGMLLGLMAADVKQLHTWQEMTTPFFVGNMMFHIAAVLMAFAGGKLIPTEPHNQREGD